ncbi:lantibiotic dehydratase [Streptomyces sp. NPDC091287]|uniref:lantibiotic dehydratase n=1 Tax=Streptomyces sp. NPDC091287 TaxID=3365988 RepID=UPI0038137D8C
MTDRDLFDAADVVLLRVAVGPLPPAAPGTDSSAEAPAAPPTAPSGGFASEAATRAEIGRLAADPAFLTAVRLASPSLADEVEKVRSGVPLKRKRLTRALVSLTKYRLRTTYRPTPFGLFAGVALAATGPAPVRPGGGGHRTLSRPDAAWLSGVLTDQVVTTPGLCERAALTANPLRTVRDGRVVLVDHHDPTGNQQLAHSVRLTAVVAYVLERAADPVAWPELVQALAERFPQAPAATIERTVRQLVGSGFLVSDLVPPPDHTAPLDHVLERLVDTGHPVTHALAGVRAGLTALDAAPPADRGRELAEVTARMRELRGADDVIQTDLGLDTRLVLPVEVTREAARAASALWRTTVARPGMPHLRAYHLAFLERYGTGRAVPLLELLDDARGLGLPETYRGPGGAGGASSPEPSAAERRRDQRLGELMLGASGQTGVGEIVLDEKTLDALAATEAGPAASGGADPSGTVRPPRRVPGSLELGVEIVAEGWDELCAGEFRLVLGANPGSPRAGATFSRFAPALGGESGPLASVVARAEESAAAAVPGEITAAVAYRPRVARSANVATVPQWLPYRIPLGVPRAARDDVTDLRPEELAVHADLDGLRVVHTPTGRPVRPVSHSMLNPASGHLPYVARFLLDLGYEGQDWCTPWNWGSWTSAPALPRVRLGRTVLAPARWLPDTALLERAAETDGADVGWHEAVAAWRRRLRVPRYTLLTRVDNRVTVDLDDPRHLLVLHDEVKRPQRLVITEWYGGPAGARWFTAADGPHAAELVVPLFARHPRPAPAVAPKPAAPVDAQERVRWAAMPGGEWLYAKLYVPDALQHHVLARHLGRLVDSAAVRAAGVDSWFFLRYADPDPHLRVRFHGKPEGLWPVLLPAVREWGEELRDAGLTDRLVLDTYEPEVERYGGPAALHHAERVFRADSAVVLARLAPRTDPEPEPVTQAALGILDLLTGLGTPEEALAWLGDPGFLVRRSEVARATKEAIAERLGGSLAGGSEPPGLAAALAARGAALAGLREVLTAEAADPAGTSGPTGLAEAGDRRAPVAMSLAHMHCNRLLGPRREEEILAHVTAREGLALSLSRKRHGR